MADERTLAQINELSDEEHALHAKQADGSADDADRQRLQAIELELDQCWDLLRQRRARREFQLDPDEAQVRPVGTVEGYES